MEKKRTFVLPIKSLSQILNIMFGSNKSETISKPPLPQGKDAGLNTISVGTTIVGNIEAEGDMRVEGRIIGTVICNSRLIISASGFIEGDVDARNAIIEGEIKGNVVARELLQIDKTGRIFGDISTRDRKSVV